MTSTPTARLAWVDHLKAFAIILVVNMHACVTYSHVGDWYYMSEREPSLAAKFPYIIWQVLLQSFFMGLLFFFAGYFAHGSVQRRGVGAFVRERLFRLGLPALLYMLVIHPFILLALNPWGADFGTPAAFYLGFVLKGRFLGASGPLWFAVALLVFSMALAAVRVVGKGAQSRPPDPAAASRPRSSPQTWPAESRACDGSFRQRRLAA